MGEEWKIHMPLLDEHKAKHRGRGRWERMSTKDDRNYGCNAKQTSNMRPERIRS